MRFALALCLLWLSVLAAEARPVRVTSGEHKDFTRVVLQFDGGAEWVFGRTLDGYALRLPGERPEFDLGRAFDLIGTSRLAALSADPQTGDLQLGLACACHAVPFEFRPGIVVIDLYDGPPSPDSAFEAAMPPFADQGTPPPTEAAAPQPAEAVTAGVDAESLVGGYDWTRLALQQMGLEPGKPVHEADNSVEAPLPGVPDPHLDSLRQSLVEELGRGATAGLIELAPPPAGEAGDATASTEGGQAEPPATEATQAPATGAEPSDQALVSHLGESPDIALRDVGEAGPPLTASGDACLPDERLAVETWGSDRPVAEQLGPIRNGLVGEFDRPSAEAVLRVARFYIYIGFGAEARNLLAAYPDLVEDAPLLTAMAHILDGEDDPIGTFEGMEDCDTSAALWAVLSRPDALPRDDIGRAAVARSFSALPAALRRLLGPRLVEAYLKVADIQTATTLSEAVLRAPGDPSPEVVMMQADMDRALGHAGEAEARLEPLASAPGPASNDALVDLVEHRAMLGQTVSEEEVVRLEAALKERKGNAEEPRYRRALVLAKAASGDFDTAFAEAEDPDTLKMIWKLLAQAGGDTPLLNHAILGSDQTPPPEAEASAGLIADRMLMLGLADQAARWLVLAPRAPALLKAQIALANGDAEGALALVKDDGSERALHLKAEALGELGDQEGAARIYEELGKADRQWSALTEAQSWDEVAKAGPEGWKSVADIVVGEAPATQDTPAPGAPEGPLTQDKRLVDESASTRDAISNLLNSVQVPSASSQ